MTPDPRLRNQTIALVGLMGVGKSSVGRRLAAAMDLPFRDADTEVETAAGRTIAEIFEAFGEEGFRDGERRVIARLLDEGPMVLATGGGAFMNEQTRALIEEKALSVWLSADIEILARRIGRKDNRPLVRGKDPLAVLTDLARVRYPIYGLADIKVELGETPHQESVTRIISALETRLKDGGPAMKTIKTRTVEVALAGRDYPVVIGPGLLDAAGEKIAPLLRRGRTAIVADATVAELHGQRLLAALAAAGVKASLLTIPPGEASKSFEGLADLSDRLLALELDRGDMIIAFGGGVVGDLAGFAASIYKRGIDFIQIPTTLLAQVDSSVGGKTAIDTPRGKNLIGAFHQPRLVLADLDVLTTLPDREMACGMAEVIKYALLGDAGFADWLEANAAAVMARQPGPLAEAVRRCVAMKAAIVAEDEKEAGRRALLNLGHTFGHALEAENGYGEALKHGEAVAAGCALAFRFAASIGMCPATDADRAEALLALVGLPTRLAQVAGHPFNAPALVGHMAQDKKAEGGEITLVLPRTLGDCHVVRAVDPAVLSAFLISEGALG
jgi:shikimate kinase / 3-dehydroquinate synthase